VLGLAIGAGTLTAQRVFELSAPQNGRAAPVRVDPGHFWHGNAVSIEIPLPGLSVRANREWQQVRGPGDFSWAGKLVDGTGSALFTYRSGWLRGWIDSRQGTFLLEPRGGSYILIEIGDEAFAPCLGGVTDVDDGPAGFAVVLPPDSLRRQNGEIEEPSGPVIDVLVAYTEAALREAGGRAQMETAIQSMVDLTNLAFRNSEVKAMLRLAGAFEVIAGDLRENTQREYLMVLGRDETVEKLREEGKADLVTLLLSRGEGENSSCGVGNLLTARNRESGRAAFSVVKLSCAIGNLTFPHELGHNMGLEHDPENGRAPDSALTPFAFGHFVDGEFRTVMSYASSCLRGCRRVPHFSNPGVTYNGHATGIEGERDNARVLSETVDWVSRFR
jgi:hypothetical protein